MLKIREYDDNGNKIDLKELEKFGFKTIKLVGKVKYEYVKNIGKQELYNIKIADDKIIHFNILSIHNEIPNVIYDLIKADLVEKVGDENVKNNN